MEKVETKKVAQANEKVETKKVAQANEHAEAKKVELTAEQKAKKAEAAKAFSARQAELKAAAKKAATELKEFAAKNKMTLPATVTEWIEKTLTVRTGGFTGSNFFNKVFGDAPKAGDKITVLDYMKKTLKAKADLDKRVKEWAEKGIVVEYKEDPANLLNSTYTVIKC